MAWTLLRSGGQWEEFGFAHKEFMIDNDSDVQAEPVNFGPIAPGSRAHTPGYATEYERDAQGVWTLIAPAQSTATTPDAQNNAEGD